MLRLWKEGEATAADVIVDRYTMRLVALVSRRMNQRWQSAAAPEDIVQSALGSFFNAFKQSKLRASQTLSVWGLLATIAKRKMLRAINRESTAKRGGAVQQFSLSNQLADFAIAPTETGANELIGYLVSIAGEPTTHLQQILESLIAGKTQAEIADELAISERTVRRVLDRLRTVASNATTSSEQIIRGEPQATFIPKELPRWKYADFVLVRLIGAGSFGKVYRATIQTKTTNPHIQQSQDSSSLAIKFLRKQFWQHREAKELFLKEIDHASKIEHPNVVRYLGWGESPHGGPFIVQDWIDGRPLSQTGKVPMEQFLRWLLQACDALDAIHRSGIVHGDLTPNNILIDADGNIRITDFGFANSIALSGLVDGESGDQSTCGGTLGFAAPEQVSPAFGTIGPHTDIFALGGIAFWYLKGHAPFQADSIGESIHRTLNLDAPSLQEPEDFGLQAFAAKCLRKIVSERPSSITEVRRLLSTNA